MAPPVWFFLIWFAVVIVGVVVVFRFYSRRGSRITTASHPGEEPLTSWVGGLRMPNPGGGLLNATWPLARLELFPWGIRVGASVHFLRIMLPTWEAAYEEVTQAGAIRGPFGSSGVRLRANLPGAPVVFWTVSKGQAALILNEIHEHGVALNPSTERLPWTSTE